MQKTICEVKGLVNIRENNTKIISDSKRSLSVTTSLIYLPNILATAN